MVLTIFGAILLIAPFLLIFYFKDRIFGFVSVFIGVSAFHVFLAIISQFFHFFTYPIILGINIIIAAIVGVVILRNRNKFSFKVRINWLVVLAALIIIFELWSVHYFYTGYVNTIFGNQKVFQTSYPYPYFSDEWAGVSFTSYSINSNALPTVNPLIDGAGRDNFPNIFIGFFSGLAEIFLVLHISPLLGWPILALITGFLICGLVYLFTKSMKVSILPALIGALCVPWIVNSVNLPGIWFLFPFIGGSIFLLLDLIALNLKKPLLALAAGFISLFLYPPFVVFVAPIILVDFWLNHKAYSKKNLYIIGGGQLLALIVAGLIFCLQPSSSHDLLRFFMASLVRANNDGCIPHRFVWQVIPIGLLPFAFAGIISVIKKRMYYFMTPLVISLIYWLIYSFYPRFLIIDYARIAAIAAFFLMITTALGVEMFFGWLRKTYPVLQKEDVWLKFSLVILSIFLALSFSYTRHEAWRKIVLKFDAYPAPWIKPTNAPANNYLNQDDLNFFADFKYQRFLSVPWKALVIGAATNNYPLDSKPSILTNHWLDYNDFMEANCYAKAYLADKYNLKYIYTPRFNCDHFIELGHSRENLFFYKYQP